MGGAALGRRDQLPVALLRGLRTRPEDLPDPLPGDTGFSGRDNCLRKSALSLGPLNDGSLQEVVLEQDLVVLRWDICLEATLELIGVFEDVPDGPWHCAHPKNLGRSSMAWTTMSSPLPTTSRSRPVRSPPTSIVISST